jgi:GTP-binding protein Era
MLSITSRKPQTTRHRILGIVTKEKSQAVYVDTPGIHGEERKAINRYMNRAATSALNDVDLVLFVVDGLKWTPDDELVMEKIQKVSVPVMLLINKVDTIEDKEALLPRINELVATYGFVEVVPLSALKGHNVDRLQELVEARLPFSPPFFGEDQITDRSSRFLAAEAIREKVMRQLGDEVPYEITVEIEEFQTRRQAPSYQCTDFGGTRRPEGHRDWRWWAATETNRYRSAFGYGKVVR